MALRYRANQAALTHMLEGRTGVVVLHIANEGRRVEGNARRLIGVKTGALKASIGSRIVRSNPGYNVEVFAGNTPATAKYVMPHHDGSKPHIIRPRRRRYLKFQAGGRTVFARKVNHPGNRANPFLLRAAQQAGLNVRRR
jgi:hypothetical protein